MTKTRVVYVATPKRLNDGRTWYTVRRRGEVVAEIATLDDLEPTGAQPAPAGRVGFLGRRERAVLRYSTTFAVCNASGAVVQSRRLPPTPKATAHPVKTCADRYAKSGVHGQGSPQG